MTDREKAWLAAWQSGASYRAIAAQHGVDEKTVRRVLAPHVAGQRRSGPRKKPAPTAEQVAEVYASIGSIRGVEAHYADSSTPISETTVRARLAELGIVEHPDKRPRKGEAMWSLEFAATSRDQAAGIIADALGARSHLYPPAETGRLGWEVVGDFEALDAVRRECAARGITSTLTES